MSVGTVLTLGLGAFTGGGVQYIPTLGLGTSGTPPTPTPSTQLPSGVRGKGKKRELIVKLRDVENRESTAEFLKAQLRIRQGIVEPQAPPQPPKESKAKRLARQKLEQEALRNMEIERQNEDRRILTDQNNAVLTLLLIGST